MQQLNLKDNLIDYNNLFIYDNYTGNLLWANNTGRMLAGSLAGTLRKDGYVGIYLNGKYLFAHRVIWEMFNGPIPEGLFIDHIDRIRNNNRIDNLRIGTFQENHFNRTKQSNNKSGFKGVCWHKKKWVSQIKIDGKNKFLGFFDTPEEAYKKYCEVAIERYGEFVRL